jgi:Flagellar assembly protein FliH
MTTDSCRSRRGVYNAAATDSAAVRNGVDPHPPEIEHGPDLPENSELIESGVTGLNAPGPQAAHNCADADAACIRAAAIRFAAAACARALRYAVDRNPHLVARFVDEALRAAGIPHNAVVRVAPSVTSAGAASKEHDFVADSSLTPGDVIIDCAAGTLGATLEERAELLVRAAAS